MSFVRKRLTYANVAVTLALVFAMTGGAYAAKKYVITSTKQIKPSVVKQLKGKNGLIGATGPAGPAGPQGPIGAQGEKGMQGKDGIEGKEGATGKEGVSRLSGTKKDWTRGLDCKEGGLEFTVGSGTATFACNGSPWTAGGTLPKGKTEKGEWGL